MNCSKFIQKYLSYKKKASKEDFFFINGYFWIWIWWLIYIFDG